ncbi:hypothetical protein ACOSP7_014811 [Xanthoceras sorbifolium]
MKIRATQFSQSVAPPRIRSHQQLKTQAPMDRRRKSTARQQPRAEHHHEKWKNGSAREKNQRPEAANPKSNPKDQKKNMDDSG